LVEDRGQEPGERLPGLAVDRLPRTEGVAEERQRDVLVIAPTLPVLAIDEVSVAMARLSYLNPKDNVKWTVVPPAIDELRPAP
jgi:hypothetical protein